MDKINLPSHASTIVIGGGIVGASVLYHLARAGCKDAVLLEKNELTSGTTWHSAALVSPLRANKGETSMVRYSAELYESLEAETGISTGFRRTGHLNIAASSDRLEELRNTVTTARAFGLDAELISAKEAAGRWPMMRGKDLIGAVWTPSSGRADPSNICAALIKGARAGGARAFEHAAVTGIRTHHGRVTGVDTPNGAITCETVVNCAGLWGRQTAKLAGLPAPLHACEHFYLLTAPIDGLTADLPVLRDGDAYLYIREEVGGLLVGCFEPNPRALPLSRFPRDASFVLFDEDWDHFMPMMDGAIHRIPALESAEVRTLLNGPESFTPDNSPLMGESPSVGGFWYACGLNSAGIALGGGVGLATARWIIDGEPPFDLTSCDIRRFSPVDDNLRALSERVPEVLANHFTVRYPGREYRTARNVRRSPMHAALGEKGAVFAARSGWERALFFDPAGTVRDAQLRFGFPAWHESQGREHRAAREGVALFDQSSFGKLLVQGVDAEAVLQRICANDIAQPGRAVYTAMLNANGGFESDLTVIRLGADTFLAVTGTAQTVRDCNWIARHIRENERATVADVTPGWSTLLITGPGSRALLASLTPEAVDSASFPFGAARSIEIGYARALVARLSYAGELGFELHVASEQAVGLYEMLREAGEAFGLVHSGAHALASLRTEKAFRSWGHDIGPRDTPLEAGLGFAVAFSKSTPFIGKQALMRQRERGVGRRLLAFTLDGQQALPVGHHPILRDGRQVGETTSCAWGFTLGCGVCLGWVESGSMAPEALLGDPYAIDIATRCYPAMPHLSPPYDPQGKRMRI